MSGSRFPVLGRKANRFSRFAAWSASGAKILSIAAPVLATIIFFLARESPNLFWWAAGTLLLSLLLQLTSFAWERRLSAQSLVTNNVLNTDVARMAAFLAAMPRQGEAARVSTLNELARYTVDVLVNVYQGVKDVRAIAYTLGASNDSLEVFRHAGLREPSGPFLATDTGRGQKALSFVLDSSPASLFIPNIAKERPDYYGGSGQGYGTFISVRIHDGSEAYGMLTLDAARVGELTQDDVKVVQMFANLLAVAFGHVAAAGSTHPRYRGIE